MKQWKLACGAIAAVLSLAWIAGCGEQGDWPSDSSGNVTSWGTSSVDRSESSFTSDWTISLVESSGDSEPPESSEVSDGFAAYRHPDEPRLNQIRLPEIAEEGFSFLDKTLTVTVGRSKTVRYEFKPVGASNRALTWRSSDESVVTVSDGRVQAVGVGTATVTATTAGGRKAECRVTVVAKDVLSPVAALIEQVTEGNVANWQFALFDVNLDGTKELVARHGGVNGTAQTQVLRVSDGAVLLTLETGGNEEWAIWERTGGTRFVLVSFAQTLGDGTRYVMEEVTADAAGALHVTRVLARETHDAAADVFWVRNAGGELISCTEESYRTARTAYFAANRQLSIPALKWQQGASAQAIADKLGSV